MTPAKHTFHWRPGASREVGPGSAGLDERLVPLAEDRASTAAVLVTEASRMVLEWLQGRGEDWGAEAGREELDSALAAFREAHGWRGSVAHWLDALEQTLDLAARRAGVVHAREVLAEELGLWLGGADDADEGPWSGAPLARGRRLPDRGACVEAAVHGVERGEVILVHGHSETVALALEEIQGRALAPEVVLSEGGPDLGGRRMARRLAPGGIKLRFVYDAALLASVARADRIWLGTEAIGAQGFIGRIGTRALLEEARRREVPTAVLATSDKLTPRGTLSLPAWSERDSWLLWENAPEGVRVDSQAFETVPLELVDAFATEAGLEGAADLSLRSLRTGSTATRQLDPIP